VKNNKLRKNILVIISIVLGLVILFILMRPSKEMISEIANDPGGISNNAPGDYIDIFNRDSQQKLISTVNIYHKFGDTISSFVYDGKYDLQLTKINTKSDLRFTKDIIEAYTTNSSSNGVDGYVPLNEAHFQSMYALPSPGYASKIYLSLIGDSTKTVAKNDTIASYYLKLKNVCIRYKPDSTAKINIEAKTSLQFFITKQPVSVMLLTRKKSLYFLLLTAINGKDKLDPQLLSTLINKK